MRPGGYAWWYVDATSDDGRNGLTIIAFIGSVFSPYYHWSGRRDPENHCAINVALYGVQGRRWTMTERGRREVSRNGDHFALGPSALRWDGSTLDIEIAEMSAPIPRRVRGRVRLYPDGLVDRPVVLDEAGDHRWWPIAPSARIEVEFTAPEARWQGAAYLDSNAGGVPLQASFRRWTWCRAAMAGGTAVFYDLVMKDGGSRSLALRFDPSQTIADIDAPPIVRMRPTPVWRMAREMRCDKGRRPSVERTLEDAPFYARSLVASTLFGQPVQAIHESLSLTRLDTALVRQMLPWRMPRRFF